MSVVSCLLILSGCAKHSDFVEVKESLGTLAKAHEQTQKRQEAIQRRLQGLEEGKPIVVEDVSKGPEAVQQRLQDLTAKLNELEGRLARVESGPSSAGLVKPEEPTTRQSRATHMPEPQETAPLPGTPSISPTSAFNLAYNDYLNGRYELAVTGFQRFLRDFPSTSLAPNAHYWTGESYFSLKDYGHATQAFQRVVSEFPRSEKVPPALFKLGLTAMEIGDASGGRKYLKRVIEEFSTSDEAKLAKNKLAEIR
ncbi:MAG: tol-pal system protein YbgF [Nitrospiraceae bacterium]